MPKFLPTALLGLTLASAALLPVAAQEAPTDLTCTFDNGTSKSSDDRPARRADSLRLNFTAIDPASGVATIAAEDRSIGVAVILAGHIITFLEIMPSGNLAVTTVSTLDGDEHPAVHSRHVFDSLTPGYVATQLYGTCVGRK